MKGVWHRSLSKSSSHTMKTPDPLSQEAHATSSHQSHLHRRTRWRSRRHTRTTYTKNTSSHPTATKTINTHLPNASTLKEHLHALNCILEYLQVTASWANDLIDQKPTPTPVLDCQDRLPCCQASTQCILWKSGMRSWTTPCQVRRNHQKCISAAWTEGACWRFSHIVAAKTKHVMAHMSFPLGLSHFSGACENK